jgi:hypothetical protein
MIHRYTRHTYTSDGRHLVETAALTNIDVACTLGTGTGGRLEFLELVNRWNRAGLAATVLDAPRYVFIAESGNG